MPLYRFMTLTLLLAALAIAGCGGDDGGGGDGDDGGGAAPAAISDDDPANVIPAGLPVVIAVTTDLEGEQAQSALAFADRVDPSDKDLEQALRQELESDDVSFAQDVEPWLGDRGMVALDDFESEDVGGVAAAATTDEAAAQKTLDKANAQATERTYKDVRYAVDGDDQSANGIVEGFVVAASDEAHFKQAVDAAQGSSLADDSKYADTLGLAPDDALGTAYVDVDGVIEAVKASGEVPPGTFDQLEQVPGFEPGMTAVLSVDADDDAMTFETHSSGPLPEQSGGPDLAELAGDAWVALAAPIDGQAFSQGFNQGLEQSGVAGAGQILESVGLPKFLEGLQSVSMRFGGDAITSINGELTIGGSDAAAAKDLITKVSPFAQQAASSNGVQLETQPDGLSAQFGPYAVALTSDGGDVKLRVGDEPGSTLGDQASFKRAQDELDLDDGATMVGFLDFAPMQQFLTSLPQDQDLMEAMPVLEQLGLLAIGYGEDDGHAASKAILTLR